MARAKYLAWIDLETTGVSEHNDPILEVGMVITESKAPFTELGDYEAVIEPNPTRFPNWRGLMGSYVTEMHTKNGLIHDITTGAAKSAARVEQEMIAALSEVGREHQFMIAGSGVGHFDRKFLATQMPEFCGWLQYPNLDVGVIRRAFSFCGREDLDAFGQTFATKDDKPHRGLADVRDHLNEMRAYAELFDTIPQGGLADG
jgi:oligoribonuclease (3'-5' exoribonuclease)